MSDDMLLQFREAGVIGQGHFGLTPDYHSGLYFEKDRLTQQPKLFEQVIQLVLEQWQDDDFCQVASPAKGAIPFGHALSLVRSRTGHETGFVYSEWVEQKILEDHLGDELCRLSGAQASFGSRYCKLRTGDMIIHRRPSQELRRGYAEAVRGRRVLAFEDTITTGESAWLCLEAVRRAGGEIIGLATLCDRSGGKVTAEGLNVPKLSSLVRLEAAVWPAVDCPLCKRGVPKNTQFGHI